MTVEEQLTLDSDPHSPAPSRGDAAPGAGEYFGDVVRARLERRVFLQGLGAVGVGLVALPAFAPRPAHARGDDPGASLRFSSIAPSGLDEVIVPEHYEHDVVIRWGDPLLPGAEPFSLDAQTAERQAAQFGFNCDFVAEYPLPAWLERSVERSGELSPVAAFWLGSEFPELRRRGAAGSLLWVNHEYTSGSEMFVGYDAEAPSAEQVEIELMAHGGSLVKLRKCDGRWSYDASSRFNRRITGATPMKLTGPAAGDAHLKTSADATGRHVVGMFNNCGGGITPWGTVLTCEENFDQYFANGSALASSEPAKAALYARLPAPGGASERKWERFHPRFDLAQEPNEYARFGYVVELDPYDPASTPRKHTALGRFKHEAAVPVVSPSGRVVVYSGDDARFEYVYKFVSDGKFRAHDRRRNLRLLESGTFYVARFHEDGTGSWLPLVHGEWPPHRGERLPQPGRGAHQHPRRRGPAGRDQDGSPARTTSTSTPRATCGSRPTARPRRRALASGTTGSSPCRPRAPSAATCASS